NLTPQTVHQVKRVLVDTLACAMGGYLSEPAKIARQLASTVKSDGEHGSRILGTRECSSPELAGFANAVMVRYLDYNDMSVGGHPSDAIPGPLAVAYPRGSDGRAVITAIVVNYEVARQVGSHVQQTFQRGWDHGILRALGAGRAPRHNHWPERARGGLRHRQHHGPGPCAHGPCDLPGRGAQLGTGPDPGGRIIHVEGHGRSLWDQSRYLCRPTGRVWRLWPL